MNKRIVCFYMVILLTSFLYSVDHVRFAIGNWEPYTSSRYESYQVFERMITEIFSNEGIEVQFSYFPWKRSYEEVKIGRYDATFPWVFTEERESDFIISEEVMMTEKTMFFYHRDLKFHWNEIDDLKEFRIGGTLGYANAEELEDQGLTIDWANDEFLNFKKLLHDRIDIYPASERVGLFLISQFFEHNEADLIVYHEKPLKTSFYYLLISKEIAYGEQIKIIFDRGLRGLKASGRYDEILSGIQF